jgi:drug/metabolite transporter, DME family
MDTAGARLQALAAAVLFSTGGAGLKTAAFTAAQLSTLRSGIAAVALLIWIRGRVSLSAGVLGAAVAYATTVTLFVASTKLTTAASAIFLQASAPLLIVPLGAFLLNEHLRLRDLPFLAVMAVGMWLSFSGRATTSGTAPDPASGNLLALVCSVTWAVTLLSLRALERQSSTQGSGLSVVVLGNAIAAIAASPFAWPLPAAPAVDWATVLYLGVFQIAVAYWCLTAAVRHLPALEVSLLLLLEPVLNPIWTWLVRGEAPGGAVIAGGAVILGATAIRAVVLSGEVAKPVPFPD